MFGFSIAHLIVVLIVALILFGSGKISSFMVELAKGIKSFKRVMDEKDLDKDNKEPPKKD